MLVRILKDYLHPYRSQVWFVTALLLVQSLVTLYLPKLNADLINNGVARGDVSYIWRVGAFMLLASAIVMLTSIVIAYYASQVSMAFGRDLRKSVFVAVEKFSSRELNAFGAPSLITRNTNDVQQIQMVLFMGLTMMLSAPITGIGGIIMAVRTDVKLSALLLISVPVMSFIIWMLLRRVVPLFRVMQIKIDRINLILREQISGIRVIRAFVKTDYEEKRFDEANDDLMQNTLKVTRTFALMFPSLTLILNLSSVAVIWFGGQLVNSGNMPIGNLTAFLQYLMQILMSVMMGVMMSLMIPRAATSAERVIEVLDTPSTVVETENPKSPTHSSGLIEFRNVEFRYPGAEQPVLSNISFTAHPGQTTAIVGSTGSGKTTLLNLISRFIEVTDGQVLVNDIDVRELALEVLWSQLALVPQRSFLFGGTIATNLKYGDEDCSEADMWTALTIAQARDFVEALPEQLNAPIAQGGTNLSGGQRQRISIARAIVKNAPIMLLDDSFSALDFTTDAKLRAALREYAQHATLIVVAQRISSILSADQIIVLDQGQIAGIGTHSELIKTCTVYQEIVFSQLDPEELS